MTMKWWNDLWLNEGFASWVEVLGSQVATPNWGVSGLDLNSKNQHNHAYFSSFMLRFLSNHS